MKVSLPTQHIAFIGNYSPRLCGIATFTKDICDAIGAAFPSVSCIAGVMNDRPEGYDYSSPVLFEIDQEDRESYLRAAAFLQINNVEVVCVQHEFGIYGGADGVLLLEFLRRIDKPVVITLHTILESPTASQMSVIKELDSLCERFIVMAEHGCDLLTSVYGVDLSKIDFIPHGVIDMPFVDSNFYKDIFDAEGKTVLLTFGLISPNKGIETAIEAMPAILKDHPDTVYLIVGATHPNVLLENGEAYRDQLSALAGELGVSGNVVFHNEFLPIDKLKEFIGGADIYITPYRNKDQITSGALAYAFGTGKAVISTPYWHAEELLSDNRGVLVPFSDPAAIATAVHELLTNPIDMVSMRRRAWKEGRSMIWSEVAKKYMQSFNLARAGLSTPTVAEVGQRESESGCYPVPELNLEHLYRMSDHTGIFQHAIYSVPNFHEAYCTDDNARAFIFTVLHQSEHGHDVRLDRVASSYLAFLWYAFDANTRRFRNFMSHGRRWLESKGSEDSHARALWAVGTALGHSENDGFRHLSALLFQRGLGPVKRFSSPRAWAFTLVAISEYLLSFSGDRKVEKMQRLLVARLVALYRANSSAEWQWFERIATYDNAKLSHALIVSGDPEAIEIGLSSLRWIINQQIGDGGQFSPIGCHGFWKKGKKKARFDQQPVEAYATVSACMAACRQTGDQSWAVTARWCFDWFLGRNDLGLSLYDPSTGGCRDALLQDHLNQNQGAESSLSFLLARSEITVHSNL